MSERTEKILNCDQCGNESSDKGEMWIGGHPHGGWLHVQKLRRSDYPMEHGETPKSELDFCSEECLTKHFEPPERDMMGGARVVEASEGPGAAAPWPGPGSTDHFGHHNYPDVPEEPAADKTDEELKVRCFKNQSYLWTVDGYGGIAICLIIGGIEELSDPLDLLICSSRDTEEEITLSEALAMVADWPDAVAAINKEAGL